MYDVIVVGGGPSGSLCAYYLAKENHSVLLIEKQQFPRPKLCGGGVSYKASLQLKGIIDLDHLQSIPLQGSYLCYKNEHLTHVGQNITSYSTQREDFDNALLEAARLVKCDILMPAEVENVQETPSKVIVETKDHARHEAAFVVFAEGINGRVHQRVGYVGHRAITMALEVDVTPSYVPPGLLHNTLFDFGSIPRGYAWIFPKGDRFNIGAYWYKSPTIDHAQQRALERFISLFDWAIAGKVGKVKGAPLPYLVDYPMYNTARTLLVGDVAGTLENFYGEGFYYGFQSSKIAAEAIHERMVNDADIDVYTRRLKAEVLVQVKFSRITASQFYPRQRFGYYNMVRNKLLNKIYAELIHGSISQRKTFFFSMGLLVPSVIFPNLPPRPFAEVGMVPA